MPHCVDDRYPMIPVRETAAGEIRWACSNPWHPRDPGSCPHCGYAGRPSALAAGMNPQAYCRKCHTAWIPPPA